MWDSLGVPREATGDFSKSPVPWCSDGMVSFGRMIREGRLDRVTDVVERFTGRKPKSLRELMLERRHELAAGQAALNPPSEVRHAQVHCDVVLCCLPPRHCPRRRHAAADQAAAGLKAALNQGASKAIALLGRQDGFFGNPDVHIPLPGKLQKARKTLKKLGLKKQTAALELAINRAAEAAVPEARQLFVDAIARMSVADALSILKGPEDAATQYFRATMTRAADRSLPAHRRQGDRRDRSGEDLRRGGCARPVRWGWWIQEDASLDAYVTRKALDGLFLMMAREEAAIRKDPLGQADALLRSVFGSLK